MNDNTVLRRQFQLPSCVESFWPWFLLQQGTNKSGKDALFIFENCKKGLHSETFAIHNEMDSVM